MGHVCPECNEERTGHWHKQYNTYFIGVYSHYCDQCNTLHRQIAHNNAIVAIREERIQEQIEALKRAFPQGPYR
jgi:wobble nucleotide-excising tRNase